MRLLTLLLLLVNASLLCAQPYSVGTRGTDFFDPDRSRTIGCTIYYPADVAGADVPVSQGTFPVLMMGHGFVMTVDAYTYIGSHFAAQGYFVVLPTTEGGFAPDHATFGADLAYLVLGMQQAGADAGSPFFEHVAPASALMGHSMGGGAAFLGAAANSTIQTLVTLAPAETNPSAIAAAMSVSVPSLVFAASEDCVTPVLEHARPMYDALEVPCKAFVNITGGGHCYFGDNSFTCSFGELTCGPDLTFSRDQQHAVVTDVTDLWLDHFLRGSQAAYEVLLDTLGSNARFIAEHTCGSTFVEAVEAIGPDVYFDAVSDRLVVEGARGGSDIEAYDTMGRCLFRGKVRAGRDMFQLPSQVGTILVRVISTDGASSARTICR